MNNVAKGYQDYLLSGLVSDLEIFLMGHLSPVCQALTPPDGENPLLSSLHKL